MESITDIDRFLNIDACNGYGYGTGYSGGNGGGNGTGRGTSCGYGYGRGTSYGYGYGYGTVAGLISFNGFRVKYVDRMATIIKQVKGNLAKGFIINNDLTIENCYVVKNDSLFAHGRTLEEARKALQYKMFNDMGTDKKIDLFLEKFNLTDKYPAKDFYEWHHSLTGSCEMGRNAFVKNHGIDLENDKYTVREFIDLTKDHYGREIIKTLEERISE